MTIERINQNQPRQDQINDLNEMIMQLNGMYEQAKFNINELVDIYAKITSRKYLRNQGLGNTVATYTGWSHLKEETGYSIWKYTPTTYTYNSVNNLYFGDKATGEDTIYQKLKNKGQATAESATSFDKVFVYEGDSGVGYTDNTTEAASEAGTEFVLMDSINDYLYVGDASTFAGLKFEFQTRGASYELVVEYWNGSAWTTMTANANTLVDNTSNFEGDGSITFDTPSDWATTAVNGSTQYWVRFSTTEAATTTAKAYYIVPSASVIGLLALSSTEVSNENWVWCSFGGSIYVTIRNSGNSDYEGNQHITSASNATNLQNFFIYNHEYIADYERSTYSEVTPAANDLTLTTNDSVILVDASSNEVTVTLPVAAENEGKRFLIKVVGLSSGSSGAIIDTQSGETIDNEGNRTLLYENKFVEVISDGSNWWVIGEN